MLCFRWELLPPDESIELTKIVGGKGKKVGKLGKSLFNGNWEKEKTDKKKHFTRINRSFVYTYRVLTFHSLSLSLILLSQLLTVVVHTLVLLQSVLGLVTAGLTGGDLDQLPEWRHHSLGKNATPRTDVTRGTTRSRQLPPNARGSCMTGQ